MWGMQGRRAAGRAAPFFFSFFFVRPAPSSCEAPAVSPDCDFIRARRGDGTVLEGAPARDAPRAGRRARDGQDGCASALRRCRRHWPPHAGSSTILLPASPPSANHRLRWRGTAHGVEG